MSGWAEMTDRLGGTGTLPDRPWSQHAREHAAETIAWGLMDHDMTLVEIGSPAADVLSERFVELTGAEPIR